MKNIPGVDFNNNWKPTEGQAVSMLIDVNSVGLKKGDRVTVHKVSQCNCGRHLADIGKTLPESFDSTYCVFCDHVLSTEIFMCDTCILAPIQHQYTDISKEIMEKFPLTEEVPDKALVPETVNN